MRFENIERKGIFINGEELPCEDQSAVIETRNPADGDLLALVAVGGDDDISHAVESSSSAFAGWSRTIPAHRGRILSDIAAKLREGAEEFARLETLDNGKPLAQSRSDVEGAARYFEFFAGTVDKANGDTIPLGPDYLAYTELVPYGVVGHILPWNAPLQQAARGLAPALAAGNTCVVKPAEDTPLSALAFARLATSCGLPAGVLNVVPGYGEVAGAALARHPGVRKVVFTGSVETGRVVNLAAADRLVSTTLELGGKSANIVFDDADLRRAAIGATRAINLNAGQNCSAGSRLLVQRKVHDQLVDMLQEINSKVSLGPGLEDPDMGPITTADQFAKVNDYLRVGEMEGATAVRGGISLPSRSAAGLFIEPTIFLNATNDMRICREEIFGPVLCVQEFDDEAEAVYIANDSTYGLVAGIWSQDVGRVHRTARALDVGQVYVNEYYAGFPGGVETPFGGTKQSGFGREKGIEAIEHYTQTRTVVMRVHPSGG